MRKTAAKLAVIPAQAGIQFVGLTVLKINRMYHLDSRLRGNDGYFVRQQFLSLSSKSASRNPE